MNLTLHVWRQQDAASAGRFVTYPARDISPDMSFLEMLDVVNEGLIGQGEPPIAFDHDCREGICGTCGVVVRMGPCARPLTTAPQVPQMPSRQSCSKAIGSFPSSVSCSFTTSSISRKDMSVEMSRPG